MSGCDGLDTGLLEGEAGSARTVFWRSEVSELAHSSLLKQRELLGLAQSPGL